MYIMFTVGDNANIDLPIFITINIYFVKYFEYSKILIIKLMLFQVENLIRNT